MSITNIRWSYFWMPTECGTEILYLRDDIPSCTRLPYELSDFASICRVLATLP